MERRISRRRFALLAAAGALANSATTLAQPTPEAPPGTPGAATPGVTPPAGPPAAGTPAAVRTVAHALGETLVEGVPARPVALEWDLVEGVLALGVQPAGVADIAGYQEWVNIPPQLAGTVAEVGTRQEPSVESITALRPDLILGTRFRHEAVYDTFGAIAPTLLFDPYGDGGAYAEMERAFRGIATALDREAEAEAVLAGVEAHYGEVRAALEAAGSAGRRYVLAQAFSAENQPQIRLFLDSSLAVQTIDRVGLANAYEGSPDQYGFNTVGVEALLDIQDADFLYIVQDEDDVFANQFAEDPIWRSLAFNQEARAYPLGGDTWAFGGPLSAVTLVDRVAAVLTA